MESISIVDLLVFVPAMLLLVMRLYATYFNLFSRITLPPAKGHTTPAPKATVSLLIPCRNEEENLPKLFGYLEKLDEFAEVEVLFLNDHSSDRTEAILAQFCAAHPNVRLLQGADLPAGWLGKNWACHQLAQASTGAYLLFIDADVMLAPNAIEAGLEYAQSRSLKVLSLFPDQVMISTGEMLVVPIMHTILLSLLPLPWITKRKHAAFAAANGQFMLCEGQTYRQYWWHQRVKQHVVEDIQMVREAKTLGLKCATLLGGALVTCRMYRGFNEAVDGFSKNLYAGSNYNPFAYIGFWSITLFAPIFLALHHNLPYAFALLLVHCTIHIGVGLAARFPLGMHLLLSPLRWVSFTYVVCRAIVKYYQGNITWKGRKLSL